MINSHPQATITRVLFLWLAAAFFITVPIWSLLSKGPFLWHILQPEAWQGFLEIVVLCIALFFALGMQKKPLAITLFCAPLLFYCRRHGIDLSIVAIYLYIQGILNLGWITTCLLRITDGKKAESIYISLITGILIWSALIWTASAIGVGNLEVIRLGAICLLGTCLMIRSAPRLYEVLSPWALSFDKTTRAAVAFISTLFVALFAKISSAQVANYDSMWYGLQLDKSMLAEGGMFSGQGLVALVHYYPKAHEALLIPFAGADSISLLIGVSVYSWLGIIAVSYSILREMHCGQRLPLLIAMLIASIPALFSVALTAKGDAFATFLALVSLYFLLRFYETKKLVSFTASIAAIALAPLARLSILPYAFILVVFLVFLLFTRRPWRCDSKYDCRASVLLISGAVLVASFVIGRSIILAGVPFVAPDLLVEIAGVFGLVVPYGIGSLPFDGLRPLPFLYGLWSYLFQPGNLGILLISWIGNAWVFLPLMALLLGASPPMRLGPILPIVGCVVIAFLLALAFTPTAQNRGLDGNYFIFPVTASLIAGGILLKIPFVANRLLITKLALVFSSTAAAVCFVTTDWGPGTRKLDVEFTRVPFEMKSRRQIEFNDTDGQELLTFFKAYPSQTRVVGVQRADDANEPSGWLLPIRYEPLEIIAWSRPESLTSESAFEEFLYRTDVAFIILPQGYLASNTWSVVCGLLERLTNEGRAVSVLSNNKFEVFQLAERSRVVPTSSTYAEEGYVGVKTVDLKAFVVSESQAVVVSWYFPAAVGGVRVEVASADGKPSKVWAEGGSEGSERTGPWVSGGTKFIFKSLVDGRTLATSEVR